MRVATEKEINFHKLNKKRKNDGVVRKERILRTSKFISTKLTYGFRYINGVWFKIDKCILADSKIIKMVNI